MSNFFDQFDAAPQPVAAPANSAAGGNYFDQFDQPAAPPGRGWAKTLDDYLGLAAKGLSFGLADRIGAAGDTALGSLGIGSTASHADNLARNRATIADAEQAHPIGAPITEFAAGVALPLGALGLAGRATSLAGRVGEGALVGSGLGAVSGAAGSQDLTDVSQTARDASLGAVGGGVIGAALPAAGAGLGKAYSAVAPFFTRSPDAGRVASGILGNLVNSRTDATLARLGPDAMLADASPSLTGLAGGVITRPGPGADELVDALMTRQAGQARRLADDRGAALGPAFSPQQIAAQLDKTSTASPLLDQAYAQGPLWNPELAAISQRPAVAKALRAASDMAADAGNPLPMISLDETGSEVSPSARAAYEAYTANAVPRTQQALADLLGHGGTLGTGDSVVAQRAADAGPLYDQFRASDIPTDDGLRGLMQRPSVRAALPAAERLAQDEGRSIYVPGSDDLQPDPLGPGPDAAGSPPSRFDDIPPPDGDLMPRPDKPSVPRPQSLVTFLQQAGGVRDTGGDLKAMGLDRFPGLVRTSGGLSPDMARQAAAQAGYLGAHIDDAMANTDINHLLDALDRHPAYSVLDDDAVHAWEQHDNARSAYDAQGRPQSPSAAPPRAPLDDLDAGAPATPSRQVTPEGWDYVKRALDDKIGKAQRAGANNQVRVWTGLKGELTDALDRASPVYAQARQVYAGHSALMDALTAGKTAVAPATTREQVEREFAALGTDGERQMYRLGAGNALRDLVAAKGDDADLARSIRGNLAIRSKLATLAPSPDALAAFNGTLDAQSHAFDEALRPDVRGWAMARDHLRQQQASASGAKADAIGATADAIDAHLHTIPEMMRADLARGTAERGQAAFDKGRTVLRGGDDQPWAADLSTDFDKMPLEQQALLRAGARSDIEQRFGQNRNDLSALARLLGDENDVNRAHMGTLFGDANRSALVDALTRENTFANTNNRVAQNSATAGRLGGSKLIEDATKAPEPTIPKDATLMGLLGHAGETIVRKGASMVADAAGERAREQLGRLLSLTGPERDRVLGGLATTAASRQAQAQALARALAGPAAVSGVLAERRVGR